MRITEEVGPEYAVIPYVEDHLILAVPHGHPLDDGRTSVRIEDLVGYPLMSTTSPNQKRTIQKLCDECGVKLNMVATLSRSDVIVEMIRNGFGCAFLQEYPTKYYFGDSIVRLPVEPSSNNTMALVYIKNRPLSLAMRSFIRIVFPDGITGGLEL
jgi:DNA-binding transcriptional LysR family regulator